MPVEKERKKGDKFVNAKTPYKITSSSGGKLLPRVKPRKSKKKYA